MYSRESLRGEIEQIYRNPSDGFMWEAVKLGRPPTLDEIFTYCWTAYEKALHAGGPQVIGRISDIHQTIQVKISNILAGQTLQDSSTHGNVLKMNKWCLVTNDCWVLGGVHRLAEFVSMSRPTWQNSWNPEFKCFVVTAREIIGLQTFGYSRGPGAKLGPGSQGTASYVCKNHAAAMGADLEAYHLAVALRESRGAIGAADLIG
jgi:hypothetical protein